MTAWRACLGKIGRSETVKLFKVKIVRPDGSMILGRCAEPRELIQLPADLRTMSADERRIRMAERRPAPKHVSEDTEEASFDFRKYTAPWKRSSN